MLFRSDIANNNEHNRIAHEHFTLLISNDLAYNKKYANFYKELCKEYIEILQNHDVEIRFLSTSKIDKLCYANDYQFKFTRINSFFDYQSILRKLITDEEQLNFSEFDVNFVEAPIIISEEQGDLLFGVLQTVSIHESRISSQEYWYNIENPRYIPKSRINRHRQYRLIDDTPNPVDMDNNPLLPPGTIIGTLEVNDNSFQLTMNNGTSLYRESDDSLVNSVAEDINSSFVGYNQTIEAGLIAEEQISSSSQINAINTVMINNEVRQVATNIDGLEFLVPRDYEDYEEENESHEEEVEAPYGNEEEEYEDEHPFL